MTNKDAPHDPNTRPAVGGPVQRMVRPHEVASRAYIEWQCGASGMTLNRLAEVCGCFAEYAGYDYGCRHPAATEPQCLGHSCPLAAIDYPEGATEAECDLYGECYGDEMYMALLDSGAFGTRGKVRTFWMREVLRPNG